MLVDVEQPKLDGLGAAEGMVLHVELKADLDAYLATTPKAVTVRTLDQAIVFNDANKAIEMPFFEQETFIEAAKTDGLANPEYLGARAKSLRLAGKEGIDAMLTKANATILVEPTYGMPWLSDTVYGDNFNGPSASELPAVAGYPHLTVPMGLVRGVPVGLSFIATAWADRAVLNAGYVYEQAARARVAPDSARSIGGRGTAAINRRSVRCRGRCCAIGYWCGRGCRRWSAACSKGGGARAVTPVEAETLSGVGAAILPIWMVMAFST